MAMANSKARMFEIADSLDKADRLGASEDIPEGARYIMMSDTLARGIAADILLAAMEYPICE